MSAGLNVKLSYYIIYTIGSDAALLQENAKAKESRFFAYLKQWWSLSLETTTLLELLSGHWTYI